MARLRTMATHNALFPALLKYWRNRRGLSQLDLALAAEVSARHLSFLETARAQPSAEMVLRLCTSLQLPLREQNALLRAAGHEAAFAEPALDTQRDTPVHKAIQRMLQQQEPYPMVVMNRRYDILSANAAAARLFPRITLDPTRLATPPNVFHGLFDPRLSRSFVVDWERTARQLLARLHLEALAEANPFTLSGGEKRRLSVATALATAPSLLVLDEPTFGQDRRTWGELVHLLAALRDSGRGIAFVTHDRAFAHALADRSFQLGAG